MTKGCWMESWCCLLIGVSVTTDKRTGLLIGKFNSWASARLPNGLICKMRIMQLEQSQHSIPAVGDTGNKLNSHPCHLRTTRRSEPGAPAFGSWYYSENSVGLCLAPIIRCLHQTSFFPHHSPNFIFFHPLSFPCHLSFILISNSAPPKTNKKRPACSAVSLHDTARYPVCMAQP